MNLRGKVKGECGGRNEKERGRGRVVNLKGKVKGFFVNACIIEITLTNPSNIYQFRRLSRCCVNISLVKFLSSDILLKFYLFQYSFPPKIK